MDPSDSRALAVELHPHSPTHRTATYYPMVMTPAGRWADVTWALHECLMPATEDLDGSARWLEARSPDPHHPCYAGHRIWAGGLAAGYAAALAVYDAEATEEPLTSREAQRRRDDTVVVPVGQLSEWVLDDLEKEPTKLHR